MKPGNNFDLLRLALALTVLLAHAAQLSRAPALAWIPAGASTLAVQGFFAISGFLMIGSFERSTSLGAFFVRRARRIYPAYAVTVLLIPAALIAASPTAVFGADWLRYVVANLGLANWLHPGIAGLFPDNVVPAVNGALWSMKFEVLCYLGVPVLFFAARRLGWAWVMAVAYGLAADLGSIAHNALAHQVLGLVAAFVASGAISRWRALFDRYRMWILVGAALALVAHVSVLQPAALAALLMAAARTRQLVDVARFGDLSYGVYLTHFPVIQALVAAGAFAASPLGALAAAIVIPTMLAAAMWSLVERPAMAAGGLKVPETLPSPAR